MFTEMLLFSQDAQIFSFNLNIILFIKLFITLSGYFEPDDPDKSAELQPHRRDSSYVQWIKGKGPSLNLLYEAKNMRLPKPGYREVKFRSGY